MERDVRRTMEALKPLDLSCCQTVGDIVTAMSRCSFGARMLGEVAGTLTEWVQEKRHATLIYDGTSDTPLARLLQSMVRLGWFHELLRPEGFARNAAGHSKPDIVVVGPFSERYNEALFAGNHRAVFINPTEQARPGQIQDGYFPDAVFADPRFVLPVLFHTLTERLQDQSLTVSELMLDLVAYGGTATAVTEGAETLLTMVSDPHCTVFLTISGAMTIAKMGLVVCDMIDHGLVQYIASTGALMAHGLVEGIGRKHYKHRPEHDDALLAAQKLNRVTDTLEPEENLDDVSRVLDEILDQFEGAEPMSTNELHRRIGQYLADRSDDRAILKSAYFKNVPVVVPAFVDSELGNDLFVHNRRRLQQGRPRIVINPELDSELLVKMMLDDGERLGIFSIGGGVPRNNTQNGAPLIEISNDRLGLNWPMKKFAYGCRICPDAPYYGHLSGCTYDENKSWRKMETTGRFTEIRADATQVWPFLVKYVLETS